MTPQVQALPLSGTGSGTEFLAGQYFSDRGYRIVERNYRARRGELDLVVEKDGELAFVEVRYRASRMFGAPVETVSRAKRRKLSLAALEFICERGGEERAMRFDILSVVRTGKGLSLEHFENAFEPDCGAASALLWH
jgi:putative endonuclease